MQVLVLLWRTAVAQPTAEGAMQPKLGLFFSMLRQPIV
jgi:hypothetical protein